MKQPLSGKHKRPPALIMVCSTACLLAAVALIAWPFYKGSSAVGLLADAAVQVQDAASWASPTYEMLHDTEVVWQAPDPSTPRGLLFLAHGCSHGAVDFWAKSDKCPTCTGLPEELRISREVLARGYAVIAISSQARDSHRCWISHPLSPMSEGVDDITAVKRVLTTLLSRQGWQELPLFAMGASSGGSFVLHLASHVTFAGVCSQIMAVEPRVLSMHHESHAQKQVAHPLPPTMFVHMTRDVRTAKLVTADIEVLAKLGIAYAEEKIEPRPLTPTWMADRCAPEISPEQSAAIYQALKAGGLLDDQDFLAHNPRSFPWAPLLLKPTAGIPDASSLRLQPDLSAISEELNVLHASHEIVSDTTGEMLDFFEANSKLTVSKS